MTRLSHLELQTTDIQPIMQVMEKSPGIENNHKLTKNVGPGEWSTTHYFSGSMTK